MQRCCIEMTGGNGTEFLEASLTGYGLDFGAAIQEDGELQEHYRWLKV